jgi:Undecaprenyl-phosphate glucose phosphotransferase
VLKKHSEFFKNLLFASDVLIICLCWVVSYHLRFSTNLLVAATNKVPLSTYLWLLAIIVVIWAVVFRSFDLYKPRRLGSHWKEITDIAKAFSLALVVFLAVSFLLRKFELSRLSLLYFWIMSIAALSLSRSCFRGLLRLMRRKGLNQRHGVLVGSGSVASHLIENLRRHPELGIKLVGTLAAPKAVAPPHTSLPVLGEFGALKRIIADQGLDIVFIALSNEEQEDLESILSGLSDEMVDVKIVPDLFRFITVSGGVDEIDGLPMVTLRGSPLYGWNSVAKRSMDAILSLIVIILSSPLMAFVAFLIKLSSPGPVFYVQERMGLDGKTFKMLKFRSMKVDAEEKTGPVWAQSDDPRRTRIGTILRRTNMDELPQMFNVLAGHMSLVGPRPERANFVEDFRKKVPGYMLRHKMKAGVTGWAQVNGLRGNTSIEDRIKYDLFYINHWSLRFDLVILAKTLWSGFKNAY